MLLKNPPKGWHNKGFTHQAKTADISIEPFSLRQATHTSQWWILWAMLFLNVTAGIGLISQLSPMGKELFKPIAGRGLSSTEVISAIDAAGGLVVSLTSIFNGLGRLFWAWVSDGMGRKLVFSILFLTQAVLYMIVPHLNNYYVFLLIACYLLACYGGGFATMPALAADAFGSENIGRIYGVMLTAGGVAGLAGPLIFAYVKEATGEFVWALYISACLLFIGFILTRSYKRPTRRHGEEKTCLRFEPQRGITSRLCLKSERLRSTPRPSTNRHKGLTTHTRNNLTRHRSNDRARRSSNQQRTKPTRHEKHLRNKNTRHEKHLRNKNTRH